MVALSSSVVLATERYMNNTPMANGIRVFKILENETPAKTY